MLSKRMKMAVTEGQKDHLGRIAADLVGQRRITISEAFAIVAAVVIAHREWNQSVDSQAFGSFTKEALEGIYQSLPVEWK
jgi:type IV secretory pathway protease TraF